MDFPSIKFPKSLLPGILTAAAAITAPTVYQGCVDVESSHEQPSFVDNHLPLPSEITGRRMPNILRRLHKAPATDNEE